jgi:HEAT repeat protein
MPTGRCLVAILLFASLPPSLLSQPPTPVDENLLTQAKLNGPDGKELVEFFKDRVPISTPADKKSELVAQLAGKETRDKAFAALVKLGPAAVPFLRPATNDLDNLEAQALARQCLYMIEGPTGANLVTAAARKLGAVRPAGAVAAMLHYLPFADNDAVAGEVTRSIAFITANEAKEDPALVKALEDESPVRRIAAVEALCSLDRDALRPALKKLLQDPKVTVRTRAALRLSDVNEEAAIPVLIDVMGELPSQPQRNEVQAKLQQIAGQWAVFPPQADDDVARRVRKQIWLAWWQSMDGPALLDEFRKRTLSDAEHEKLLGLIEKLGDETLATREKAMDDIVAMGPRALPVLRQEQPKREPRINTYLGRCVVLLNSENMPPLPQPAPRLLSLRKPTGAAEALIAFLPFAENATTRQQVAVALRSVARIDGKIDPSLTAALTDKQSDRRLTAAEVLSEIGGDAERKAVRKLLHDPDVNVRLRTGLVLAASGDRETVPELIDTIADLPLNSAVPVEDFLLRLAGDKAPDVRLTAEESSRKKCRDAWAKWWSDEGGKLDLERLGKSPWLFGQTLIVEQFELNKPTGRVLELDFRGKLCWQISGIQGLFDAQMLPNGHVLVLENNGLKLTERDVSGNILATVWDKSQQPGQPGAQIMAFQRLHNGNTFIATRLQILELDPNRKETVLYSRPNNQQDINAARRLPDGQIAFVTSQWGNLQPAYYRLDNTQKEVKNTRADYVVTFPSQVEILPEDHLLTVRQAQNKVVELDDNQKVVWEANVQAPTHAVRMTNGNTVVTSAFQRIVELDRSGRVLWEYADSVRPTRVHRR